MFYTVPCCHYMSLKHKLKAVYERECEKVSFSLLKFNNILFSINCIIKENIPFASNIMETSKTTTSELRKL